MKRVHLTSVEESEEKPSCKTCKFYKGRTTSCGLNLRNAETCLGSGYGVYEHNLFEKKG